jgi:glutathione reductase (NADPH)
MSEPVDLFVIGGGSAGVRLARTAALLGAKVVLAESKDLGGTCVNLGCVPKKLLAYGAHVKHELDEARAMGWTIGDAALDWGALRERKDVEIARLNAAYASLLVSAGVRIVRGHATIESRHIVRVGDEGFDVKHIAICTGGQPRRPAIPGVELAFTSDEFFHLRALPRSIVIAGGGYVALEIGSILAALGTEVCIVTRSRALSHFDPDVSAFARAELEKHGIRFSCGHEVVAIERTATGLAVVDHEGTRVPGEAVMLAVGRTANVSGLGLEALGVAHRADGSIEVDADFRTNVPTVHALGDVIGKLDLTPVALAQATHLAHHLFGEPREPLDYDLVPTAVFTMPPVATVGMSEPAAKAKFHVVDVYVSEFRPLKHTISGSTERTLMKMVVDRATDRVLGVHVVGKDAPEIVQGFAVALTCGATKRQVDRTIGIHPTSAEELVTMRTVRREA